MTLESYDPLNPLVWIDIDKRGSGQVARYFRLVDKPFDLSYEYSTCSNRDAYASRSGSTALINAAPVEYSPRTSIPGASVPVLWK